MAFWDRSRAESPSPHPIGTIPDEIHVALFVLDARRLEQRKGELARAQASVSRIVKCCPEATLFLNGIGRAMTGWRWRLPSGRVQVTYESGFRESPSEWATPLDEGVSLATGDELEP